jgi:superfamily II DNA helicase RecQ
VIRAVIKHKSPIVAIIGTSTGKSLTFMLPALTSTSVTVVVVLILALRDNLQDKCAKASISCVS